ncbi:DUF2807 domain-containing protein [Pedobacter sp. P351]|uniref:GIN domain-containing protein n=1 Tax=Pedobacter superstes TaxID=3133441 RepID=UPI0030A6A345
MKTKLTKTFTVIVAVIAIIASTQFANASIITTAISGVNKVHITGNVEVCLIQAESESYSVYNTVSDVQITFADNQLNISSHSKEQLKVVLAVTDLSSIETFGNAVVHSLNTLKSDEMIISLNDRSTAKISLDVWDLRMDVQNSAAIKLSGSSKNQLISIEGNSKLDATDFKLNDSYNLSGRAKLYVTLDGEKTTIQNHKGGIRS